MKNKWISSLILFTAAIMLAGCEQIVVLDPKGPQARLQANVILISIGIMSIVVIAVLILLVYVLVKYRDSKLPKDYEPPYIEGNHLVETVIVAFPVLIVIFLSAVSIFANNKVEATPEGYEDQEPLVIYASSSDWKWHFSYPEYDIETVNYLFIPTGRSLEFRLYSFGPITSFWVPQLGGQKYAMSDMVTVLHLAADHPGEMWGRNANFSGAGYTEQMFHVEALPPNEFVEWVSDIKETAESLTEERFQQLLEPGHLGQLTFNGTHLSFSPPPEGEHAGHQHGFKRNEDSSEQGHSGHAIGVEERIPDAAGH